MHGGRVILAPCTRYAGVPQKRSSLPLTRLSLFQSGWAEIGRTQPPSSVTVGAILRGDEVLIAHDDVVVAAEDHVILFLTDRTQISAVEKLFAVGFGFI